MKFELQRAYLDAVGACADVSTLHMKVKRVISCGRRSARAQGHTAFLQYATVRELAAMTQQPELGELRLMPEHICLHFAKTSHHPKVLAWLHSQSAETVQAYATVACHYTEAQGDPNSEDVRKLVIRVNGEREAAEPGVLARLVAQVRRGTGLDASKYGPKDLAGLLFSVQFLSNVRTVTSPRSACPACADGFVCCACGACAACSVCVLCPVCAAVSA